MHYNSIIKKVLIMHKGRDDMDLFNDDAERYEQWFERNPHLFNAELAAIKDLLPKFRSAVEIGVGTGIFASHLGIKEGVEPMPEMTNVAISRGISVIEGVAEELPLDEASYDLALMVTVDCFLTDITAAFDEVHRILKRKGTFIIAFIDSDTPLGELYEKNKADSDFYKNATFHSTREITWMLETAGFTVIASRQTIFSLENKLQPVRDGTGEGVFAVLRVQKEEKE